MKAKKNISFMGGFIVMALALCVKGCINQQRVKPVKKADTISMSYKGSINSQAPDYSECY